MKRMLSGIKPTGRVTLGNYIGAIKPFVSYQDEYEMIVFVANLHSMTIYQEPKNLRKNTKDLISLYLAAGLDPKKVTLFLQSDVLEHAQLGWYLGCMVSMGELSRMTQYKDKASKLKKDESIGAGIFNYPSLMNADILLYVTDVVETPDKNNEFMEKVRQMTVPVLLLINKIDLTDQEKLVKLVEEWKELLPQAEIIPISAASKFNVDYVMKRIKELLPDSPPYFGKDQWTDKPARFFVNEIIREKILLYYDKEIPYSVEVAVEEFKEEAKKIHIRAVIYVERDSQKGIIIGKQGKALKKVATEARRELERFFGKTIYLETYVKVDKDWRSSDKELRNFGYQLD